MKLFFLLGLLLVHAIQWPFSPAYAEDTPALPRGLESGKSSPSQAPELPSGLGDRVINSTDSSNDVFESRERTFEVSGFWEARAGTRTQNDSNERQTSLLETRMQLRVERPGDTVSMKLAGDLIYDEIADTHEVNLEKGEGFLDLREANLLFRPARFIDLKAGRQILTWGTGDLIFINDLFPKDFKSFFIGRDEEYLKAPSDAVKMSLFSGIANLNVAYTPRFDANRFIDGNRISFFNPATGTITGKDDPLKTNVPDGWFDDDELAARLYTNVSGYELAAYGYTGFWKGPAGFDPKTNNATFPKLDVLGLSARGTLGPGIGNIEFGYYHSGDDSNGSDPLIRNSELRLLAGYEQEVARETTLGVQYYLEQMQDHGKYKDKLPAGSPELDKNRHVVTVRLTRLAMQQDLLLSMFNFYSPSDQDGYLRLLASYRLDDHWTGSGGLNLFYGDDSHTFFGQLEDNSNVYLSIRYGFG